MTRSRTSYQYSPQKVASPGGVFHLDNSAGDDPALVLSREGRRCWSRSIKGPSLKQVFVSEDGTAATLDARDQLAFYSSEGRFLGEVSMLTLVCGQEGTSESTAFNGADSPIARSTAGPLWDDYVAAGFFLFEQEALFVVSGRGVPPFAIEPAKQCRVPVGEEVVQSALRRRAPQVLREAESALKGNQEGEHYHGVPWRLAAVGWARVAGEAGAVDAVPTLRALADLDMVCDGSTCLGWGYPQPRDRVRVNEYALDPLRQATCVALVRLGQASPAKAPTQIASREGWLRTRYEELPVPTDRTEALQRITPGLLPSELLQLVGPPTFICGREPCVVWYYDYLSAEGPRTLGVRWRATGAELVGAPSPIPPAALFGRYA